MTRRTIALGAAVGALSLSPALAGADVLPPLPGGAGALLPSASTCQVTAVDAGSVKVSSSVDPNALATTYRVEYGLAGLLNLSSPAIDVGSAPDPTATSVQLTNLVPGASYSCRIVALNAAGQTAGSTMTFTAPANGAPGTPGAGGSAGSGGTGATPSVSLISGQMVLAGSKRSVVCTLAGTKGNDRLRGTKGRDVICGLGGADRIVGLGGNDILVGGPGKDRIYAGAGTDRVQGNGGKDRLWGGSGRDRVDGGTGADSLWGGKGRDRLSGGTGNDRLASSDDRRGGDVLLGGRGRDWASMNRGDRNRSVERVRISRS